MFVSVSNSKTSNSFFLFKNTVGSGYRARQSCFQSTVNGGTIEKDISSSLLTPAIATDRFEGTTKEM